MDRSHHDRRVATPMRLLADGVPLTLLLDLACPLGPDSEGILVSELTAPLWSGPPGVALGL